MKNTSRFVFIAAATLALIWGGIEIVLRWTSTSTTENLTCSPQPEFETQLSGKRFVAADTFRLLFVDPDTTALSEFKWDSQNQREIQRFACTTPSPQCLNREPEPGEQNLSSQAHLNWVRHLGRDWGILNWSPRKNKQQLIPFRLDQLKNLALSSPLHLCESMSSPEKLQYFLFGNRIVVWNPVLSSLEIFDVPGFPGTSPRAVARRADQIWQINNLQPTQISCPDLIKTVDSPPRRLRLFGNELGLFFRPDEPAEINHIFRLKIFPNLGLEEISTGPLALQEAYGPLKSSPFIISRDEWLGSDFAIRLSSRRVLSTLQANILGPGFPTTPPLLSGAWWRWSRGQIEHSWAQKTGNRLWLIEERGGDLTIGKWRCDDPQFVKTTPTNPVIPW